MVPPTERERGGQDMDSFETLRAELAAAEVETTQDMATQADEDTANAEEAWVDYVLTFRRERKLWVLLVELTASLTPFPAPTPRPTLRERVGRMILRRF